MGMSGGAAEVRESVSLDAVRFDVPDRAAATGLVLQDRVAVKGIDDVEWFAVSDRHVLAFGSEYKSLTLARSINISINSETVHSCSVQSSF
jgi:hypothetical protein